MRRFCSSLRRASKRYVLAGGVRSCRFRARGTVCGTQRSPRIVYGKYPYHVNWSHEYPMNTRRKAELPRRQTTKAPEPAPAGWCILLTVCEPEMEIPVLETVQPANRSRPGAGVFTVGGRVCGSDRDAARAGLRRGVGSTTKPATTGTKRGSSHAGNTRRPHQSGRGGRPVAVRVRKWR